MVFGRYQHRVEWAVDFLRRQGHDESAVQKILTDYTGPLELPCKKGKEETPQHDPLNSEAGSSPEDRVGDSKLSVTPGGAGQSDDLQGLNTHSDCLQEGPGLGTLTVARPSSLNGHVVEDPTVLPRVPCLSQRTLITQDSLWPEGSCQGAGEKSDAHEYVLVEEEQCDVQEEAPAGPDEKVCSNKAQCSRHPGFSYSQAQSESIAVCLGFLKIESPFLAAHCSGQGSLPFTSHCRYLSVMQT